ncbi:hypothetical protein SAMN05216266_12466 [Amycolatopsis marina]|uniref:Preprotein translocase subunit SecG n=1 Tax=Amycolatopsis marina TaxID=490629 RepID=A0A1I1CAZ2_9PSEU|nr:hypothetical protein [Amycolatopsis marina]SFB59829.1 hypothetical protein SAMN05216266_12466 [Amycolatopsis marina]
MSLVLPAFAAAPVTTGALLLAQQQDDGEGGGQGQDFGKSSPVGLLVLILFLIAVVFLVRSMTKHLKRVPASFDKEDAQAAASPENTDDIDTAGTDHSSPPADPAQPSDRDSSDGRTANGRT